MQTLRRRRPPQTRAPWGRELQFCSWFWQPSSGGGGGLGRALRSRRWPRRDILCRSAAALLLCCCSAALLLLCCCSACCSAAAALLLLLLLCCCCSAALLRLAIVGAKPTHALMLLHGCLFRASAPVAAAGVGESRASADVDAAIRLPPPPPLRAPASAPYMPQAAACQNVVDHT
eukprot:SAG31_NODE_17620_length_664_cov_0.601770_1_plen_174_part_01